MEEIIYTNLLEVGASSEDFVYKVLDGEDVVLAQRFLDHLVVGQGNSLLVDLSVTTLVDELTNRLKVGLATWRKDSVNRMGE